MLVIIEVWSWKGGCGKSSLSLSLAGGYAARGFKVAIADMDEQQTCRTFFNNATDCPFEVFSGYPETSDYDYLIVDRSPERSTDNLPLEIADLVLVPILPSAIDAWSLLPALEALDKRQIVKNRMIVVNRFQNNRSLMNDFLKNIEHDYVVMDRAIYSRTIANYSTVFKPSGLSIFASGLKDAKNEINLLINKIELSIKKN